MTKDINWEYHQALKRIKELEYELSALKKQVEFQRRWLKLTGWMVDDSSL